MRASSVPLDASRANRRAIVNATSSRGISAQSARISSEMPSILRWARSFSTRIAMSSAGGTSGTVSGSIPTARAALATS